MPLQKIISKWTGNAFYVSRPAQMCSDEGGMRQCRRAATHRAKAAKTTYYPHETLLVCEYHAGQYHSMYGDKVYRYRTI